MASQWGRKETVIWPPQVPVYTIGTMILSVPIVMSLLLGMYFMKPFLAREYTGDYLKSAAGAQFKMHNSFRLIFLQGGKRAPRVAQHQDFVPGTTILPNGKELSVQLSPEATRPGLHDIRSRTGAQDCGRRPLWMVQGGDLRRRRRSQRLRSSVGRGGNRGDLSSLFRRAAGLQTRQKDEVRTAAARAGDVGSQSSSTRF